MGSRELNHHCWKYGITQSGTMTVLSIISPVPLKVRRIIYCWEATLAFCYRVLRKSKPKFTKKCICKIAPTIVTYTEPMKKTIEFQSYGHHLENACLIQTTWSRKSLKLLQDFFSTMTKRWYTCEPLCGRVRISVERRTGIMNLQWLLRRGWHNTFCKHSFKFDVDLVNRASHH